MIAGDQTPQECQPLSDVALLQHFAAARDERAFAELVRRYQVLVQGCCRRVLGDAGADDAVQVTFWTLAGQAAKLAQPGTAGESLGPWLYRVACRAALQQKRQDSRRAARERKVAEARPVAHSDVGEPWEQVLPLLDEEIQGLPGQYRSAVVLCYLEQQPQQAAADRLGLSYATLRRRLARARSLLRRRLVSRGVTLSGVTLGVILWNAARQAEAAGRTSALESARAAASHGTLSTLGSDVAAFLSDLFHWRNVMTLPQLSLSQAVPAGIMLLGGMMLGSQWAGLTGQSHLASAGSQSASLQSTVRTVSQPVSRAAEQPLPDERPQSASAVAVAQAEVVDVPPTVTPAKPSQPKDPTRVDPTLADPVPAAGKAVAQASAQAGGRAQNSVFRGQININGAVQDFNDPAALSDALNGLPADLGEFNLGTGQLPDVSKLLGGNFANGGGQAQAGGGGQAQGGGMINNNGRIQQLGNPAAVQQLLQNLPNVPAGGNAQRAFEGVINRNGQVQRFQNPAAMPGLPPWVQRLAR